MPTPDEYDYELPRELVANAPAEPRDAARLFVYDTSSDEVSFARFADLPEFLPERSLLVVNETKVVPARAKLRKETGGLVEVLVLVNERMEGRSVPCIAAKRLAIGSSLAFPNGARFIVRAQDGERFFLEPQFPPDEIYALLERYGTTPIPKYIKGTPLSEPALRAQYQTVFAKRPASAAAPTASLHFTERVFDALAARGIERVPVTLHVGLGTFAPVREEQIAERRLHREWREVPSGSAEAVRNGKREGRQIVAAGTTVVRTLESSAEAILGGEPTPIRGTTDLFILPPFEFRIVDALVTNFHVPRSSLMMLVDAFLRHKGAKRGVTDLYRIAIGERFRFFSFGDAMLIL